MKDLIGINQLSSEVTRAKKLQTPSGDQIKLKKAAKDFEGEFLKIVMKSMRDASPESDIFGGSEKVKFFQSMLDEQYSEKIGGGKGIGLADAIYKQMNKNGGGV